MSTDTWKQHRREAAWRKRRIIMNNDGDDARGYRMQKGGEGGDYLSAAQIAAIINSGTEATAELFLAQRFAGMEKPECQLDSIFYSTTSTFNSHVHDSKVAELQDNIDAPHCKLSMVRAMAEQGRDCLQVAVDFCHKHDKEIIWSLRMNREASPSRASCSSRSYASGIACPVKALSQ